MGGETVYYTPGEFIAHLEHILMLLESCENYHVCLIDKPNEDLYTLYVKEDLGVIVVKTSQPPVVLAINEGNLTASFRNFLKSMIGDKTYKQSGKDTSIVTIKNI
jgi:hypothetical protein